MTPGLIAFKLLLTPLPIYWLWTTVKLRFKDVPRMRAAWNNSREHQRQRETLREQGVERDDHRIWYIDQLQWMAGFCFALVAMQLIIIWGIPDWSDSCNAFSGLLGTSVGIWSATFTSRNAYKEAIEAEEKEAVRQGILTYLHRIATKYGGAHAGTLTKMVRQELGQGLPNGNMVNTQLQGLEQDGLVTNMFKGSDGQTWAITETGKGYVDLFGVTAAAHKRGSHDRPPSDKQERKL